MEAERAQTLYDQAQEALDAERWGEAAEAFQEILEGYGDSWQIRVDLSFAQSQEGNLEAALQSLRDIPSADRTPLVLENMALLQLRMGRNPTALNLPDLESIQNPELLFALAWESFFHSDPALFKKAREALEATDPKGERAQYLGALDFEQRELLPEARQLLEGAEGSGPVGLYLKLREAYLSEDFEAVLKPPLDSTTETCVPLRQLRGWAAHALKDKKLSQEEMEAARKFSKEKDPQVELDWVRWLLENSRAKEAFQVVQSLPADALSDPSRRLLAARAAFVSRHYEEASKAYRRVLEDDDRHFRAWYNLGFSLETIQNFSEAEEAYRRCLQIRPTHFKAMNKLGRIAMARGDLNEARSWSQKSMDLESEGNAEGYALRAQVELLRGETDQGLRSLEESLRRDHRQPQLWKLKAQALRARDEFNPAKEAAKIGLQHFPEDLELKLELGLSYAGLETELDRNKAKKAFKDVLLKNPKHPRALGAYAEVSAYLDEPRKAQAKIQSALEKGADYRAHFALGVVQEKLGAPREAIDSFKRALIEKKNFLPACEGISRCYQSLGDETRAEKYRRMVTESSGGSD